MILINRASIVWLTANCNSDKKILLSYRRKSSHPRRRSTLYSLSISYRSGGGRVVRRCWVNFQCRGVLLIWLLVGQGPIVLTVGAGEGCLDIFLSSITSLFFLPFWETARYGLKYCLKGPLSPKQPTNQNLTVVSI